MLQQGQSLIHNRQFEEFKSINLQFYREKTCSISIITNLESAKEAAFRTSPSSSAPVKFFVMRASSGKL